MSINGDFDAVASITVNDSCTIPHTDTAEIRNLSGGSWGSKVLLCGVGGGYNKFYGDAVGKYRYRVIIFVFEKLITIGEAATIFQLSKRHTRRLVSKYNKTNISFL